MAPKYHFTRSRPSVRSSTSRLAAWSSRAQAVPSGATVRHAQHDLVRSARDSARGDRDGDGEGEEGAHGWKNVGTKANGA